MDRSLTDDKRVACALCKLPIYAGAKKCRHCKQFQPEKGAQFPRAAFIVAVAVSSVFSVIITTRKSPVGSAPPLTRMAAATSSPAEPSPAAVGPDAEPPKPKPAETIKSKWTVREFKIGDAHPLDVTFSATGESFFVSFDDASVRQYKLGTLEPMHKATVPAKGDRLRLVGGRYLAVLRNDAAASRIPVIDTTKWDRDPILLDAGAHPADILELADGSVVTSSLVGHRVSRFGLPSGRLLSDITLPQAAGRLFMVQTGESTFLAAMGGLSHNGRPAGAWVDLFDPKEAPFGATRRSISVGREPRGGSVTAAGDAIFFADRHTNSANMLLVKGETESKTAEVGQEPVAAFTMFGGLYGVTLNAGNNTASVVTLKDMSVATLMLPGTPRTGVTTPSGNGLFAVLGGSSNPPRGGGVAIIAGDPPQVITTLETGEGAINAATNKDGSKIIVANYFGKSVSIFE